MGLDGYEVRLAERGGTINRKPKIRLRVVSGGRKFQVPNRAGGYNGHGLVHRYVSADLCIATVRRNSRATPIRG